MFQGFFTWRITAVTVLSILATANTLAKDYDAIKIATEGAYAPYNFKDESGKLVGFEIDLAEALCERMEISCEIVEQAWDGIIPSLVAGKYDAIMAGMSITKEREKVIAFSRSYAATPIRFATLKSSSLAGYSSDLESLTADELDADEQTAIDTLNSALEGKVVGVQASTTHENFMRDFLPEVELKSYDTMDNMILDLQAERIDAGYTAVTFLQPLLAKDPNIVVIGPGMTGGPLGLGVGVATRKEDGELSKLFSTAIESMIDDGSLSEMATKWFGFDAAAKK